MRYTEENIRNAFKAGETKGKHNSYFDAPLDEDEFIAKLKEENCSHPYSSVSKDLITEITTCSMCGKEL